MDCKASGLVCELFGLLDRNPATQETQTRALGQAQDFHSKKKPYSIPSFTKNTTPQIQIYVLSIRLDRVVLGFPVV